MCHYRCIGFFVVYGKKKQMPARSEKFIHVNSAKEIRIKKPLPGAVVNYIDE